MNHNIFYSTKDERSLLTFVDTYWTRNVDTFIYVKNPLQTYINTNYFIE